MNLFYEMFLKSMGCGVRYEELPPGFLEKYRDILPKGLLDFWQDEGWSSYADGLLWTINPEEYSWLVEEWVDTSPEVPPLTYYAFARNAYGEFYCLSPNASCILTISCPTGLLIASKKLKKNPRNECEQAVQSFFAMGSKKRFDLSDTNGTPMFPAALKKLGPVGVNEVYGFVPLITLGGETEVTYLEKVRMDVHIDILRQTMNPILQLL
ncbi:DUF1851 domain-containing protein [Massilia antarctica]|uniref:DUF1851 domain-containing protein n=1 Tax=Massilia antarctica TaxID=2765360 RepID=A0AA48W9M2_9BURK|nr:GAD-like domain-containing protein [Massilia antarctica]QPI47469.1 DUF1851 domain-containing protein [Massilia antarctica]